jgi:hypothetical protein
VVSPEVSSSTSFAVLTCRLILGGAKFGVAVILLFNLQISPVFVPEEASISTQGGVSDLNFWIKWTDIDSLNSGKLTTLYYLKNLGSSIGGDIPAMKLVNRTCPADLSRCLALSFLQGWSVLTRPEIDTAWAEYITLRQAPFYNFYFNNIEAGDSCKFNFTTDCNSYMSEHTHTGLKGNWSVCARRDPAYNTLAFSMFLHPIYYLLTGHLYDECDAHFCHQILDVSSRLIITQQTADMTYSLNNDSLLQTENFSEESQQLPGMDPELYLEIFDVLNRPVSEYGIERYTFYLISGFFSDWNKYANSALAVFLYPFFAQQQNYSGRSNVTKVDASYTKQGYRITLAPRSIFVFTSFNLSVLLCGLALFAKATWRGMPRGSAFPDVELIFHGLSRAQTTEFKALVSKFQMTGTSRHILKDIDEINILICPTSLSDLEAERTGSD